MAKAKYLVLWVYYNEPKTVNQKKDGEIRKIIGLEDDGSGFNFTTNERDLSFVLSIKDKTKYEKIVKKMVSDKMISKYTFFEEFDDQDDEHKEEEKC